ncbi:MAG: efflux RND transporter periplasmic adaptor subunit [Ginsengibacter sp.]|jgi:membrane fusion protein (multidrug efflux system)
MKLTKGKLIITAIFALFIVACGNKTQKIAPGQLQNAPPPQTAEAFIIVPAVLNSSILVAGTLIPFEETEIHPEVAGKVVGLYIKEGAFVRRGTLLVKLFDGDLQAQLQKLSVQLKIAKKTQERQEELLKIGGISQQDYDLSLLSVNSIAADMEILKTSIAKTIIRAPFDGKIGFKNISIGAYITPQTIITTIRQVNKLKLIFSVPEKYSSKVRIGNTITFSTSGIGRKYSAVITATESSITEENRSLKVQAIVNRVDNSITAGGFANVDFDMGNNNDAIMVPTQAVIPQARDKKVIVFRNGLADFTTVVTGIRDSSKVEILEGLKMGDTIITTGLLSIKPGSKIKISSLKK